MSTSRNLNDVLESLQSDKIKKRQDALEDLRTAFSNDKTVAAFYLDKNSDRPNPKRWLLVFQALFQSIRTELAAVNKPTTSKSGRSGAATAEKRLGELSGVVRWLTERTVPYLNKSVLKALFSHFLQVMTDKGRLRAEVALNYIKAMKALLIHTPHLDHMEDETWVTLIELGFNVILGDPLKRRFDDDTEDDGHGTLEGSEVEVDEEDYDYEDGSDDPKLSRKRARTHTPQPAKRIRSQPVIVTAEQIEFASLLGILIQSENAPILPLKAPRSADEEEEEEDNVDVAKGILSRLRRFIEVYPLHTSLHPDYLTVLSKTLSRLALNMKHAMHAFSLHVIPGLISLWSMKDRLAKEDLVSILLTLLPYVEGAGSGTVLSRLWKVLQGENGRSVPEVLFQDGLRLELTEPEDMEDVMCGRTAFVQPTFRSGSKFEPAQALTWAILELRAACAEKLYQLSELPETTQAKGVDNPISGIIRAIQLQGQGRVLHLQTLLFFISRYWYKLHAELQLEVTSVLVQFMSVADEETQTWVFLCLAAIAHIQCHGSSHSDIKASATSPSADTSWDGIWTFVIRRVNTPSVCRAASHLAHTIILHSPVQNSALQSTVTLPFINARVILSEIEVWMKDLEVQGPIFPFDSVCALLSVCIRVASKDVRLFRLRLEERALSWLVDSWSIGSDDRSTQKPKGASVKDWMSLFEAICNLSTPTDLVCRRTLPSNAIARAVVDHANTAVIRQFTLEARLPEFWAPSAGTDGSKLGANDDESKLDETNLAPAAGRERRLSAFFVKQLDSLQTTWANGSNTSSSAESARLAMDFAVASLCFEMALTLNGIRSNRRVVQGAGKVVGMVTDSLSGTRWSLEEKAFVLKGLEPLTSVHDLEGVGGTSRWEAMVAPDVGTGIKASQLKLLVEDQRKKRLRRESHRLKFQRAVWHNTDVQDAFAPVLATVKDTLQTVFLDLSPASDSKAMAVDNDDFGAIQAHQSTLNTSNDAADGQTMSLIAEFCVSFHTAATVLQSTSTDPLRNKDLLDILLHLASSHRQKFLFLLPFFCSSIRRRTLALNNAQLSSLIAELGDALQDYTCSKSAIVLVIQFLDSSLYFWAGSSRTTTIEITNNIRMLCDHLTSLVLKTKILLWSTRDALIRFVDRFLAMEPFMETWTLPPDSADESISEDDRRSRLPESFLPLFNSDPDIRVRFRAATATAHLFKVPRSDIHGTTYYQYIVNTLSVDLENLEVIATRFLTLGNIGVISSSIRRGAYWHILETAFYSPLYNQHIEAVLRGMAVRMGLGSISALFHAYASQIAYTIRQNGYDVLRMPPALLGYSDRKECAQACFDAFTPSNLLLDVQSQDPTHGEQLFYDHCKAISKPFETAILEHLGEIVGWQIPHHALRSAQLSKMGLKDLQRSKVLGQLESAGFDKLVGNAADRVVCTVLRTFGGDLDLQSTKPILDALQAKDSSKMLAKIFSQLCQFNKGGLQIAPYFPAFSTPVILESLRWIYQQVPEADSRNTVYHVLHALFADIHRSPIVGEQHRLIRALSIFVAFSHEHFDNGTLLHTLIHGAISMLAEIDLLSSGHSILHWALHKYRKVSDRDARLVDVLVRTACIAMEHVNSQDDVSRQKGTELLNWVEQQACSFSSQSNFTRYVIKALSAWPRSPTGELQAMYQRMDVDEVLSCLRDHRMTSNKFHLCVQLSTLVEKGFYDPTRFPTMDFWRVKDWIPSHPEDEDIASLADLLSLGRGTIQSSGVEQRMSFMEVAGRHRNVPRPVEGKQHPFHFDPTIPTNFIVLTLLAMLDSASIQEFNNAYLALRLLASVPGTHLKSYDLWHTEYRTELEFLQAYPLLIITRPSRDLSELLESNHYVITSSDFPQWIAQLCLLLCDILAQFDPFYAQLIQPMNTVTPWLDRVLPVFVHSLLDQLGNSGESRTILTKFFTLVLSNQTTSPRVIQSVINVVLHLRNFSPSTGVGDALAYNKWLDIEFSMLARKAVTVGAYTTALLFLESIVNSDGLLDTEDDGIEQVMFDIYSRIDEPDGFYGIRTRNLQEYLIKRFHHEGQLEKAFRFHGAALESGSLETSDTAGVLNAFHSFGFNRLAMETFHSSFGKSASGHTGETTSSLTHQLGWRTDAWDLPDDPDASPSSSTALYRALRAVHCERDSSAIDLAVKVALHSETQRLRDADRENLAEIRSLAKNLMCLNQISAWRKQLSKEIGGLVGIEDLSTDIEFVTFEMMMATRMSLIRSMKQREQRDQIGTMMSPQLKTLIDQEKSNLVRLSATAREAHQLQIALNAIVHAQRLENRPSFEVSCEFANVLWVQGELKVAVDSLKQLVFPTDERNNIPAQERVLLLAQLGSWTSNVYLEKPLSIDKLYFQEAVNILSNLPNRGRPAFATVYRQYALFAEQQYLDIINSPDSIRFKVYVERKQAEISQRDRLISTASKSQLKRSQVDENKLIDNKRALANAKRQLEHDREYFEQNKQARDQFLLQAITMHSRYLQISDSFDDDGSIRLVALWFANFESDDKSFQTTVEQALERIPSYKFTFLAHQLAARLTEADSGQKALQSLVLRMCQEHPFHSLYPVYCLQSEKPAGNGSSNISHTLRSKTAQNIIGKLIQMDQKAEPEREKKRVQRVQALRLACDAYLQWAKYPLGKEERPSGKSYQVPRNALLRKLSDIPVAVATADIALDKTLNYEQCVCVAQYDQIFTLAGGRNRPKIIQCIGNNGQAYKQLFKGEFKDDLRQDAVMEQVFDLVNRVLKQDGETRRRDLRVRDYKVIPLSSHAGLMEFVDNTTPLASWLGEAHKKYRPRDLTTSTGQKFMREAQETKKPEVMLEKYLELRKKIKPVMRHYFTERSKDPMAWFTMRLHYTRSAATTSIVGHVLGLGDRHTSNILLDKGNGELVHIDLGISFDQGKVLPIPERVPFRMTRDMVDGMGSSGTQGVFQRCAEETLRVLRDGSRIIMTVLEVFKHDPLYSWTASDFKINKAQPTASSNPSNATQITMASTIADPRRLGIGIDMDSGTAEEDVDRALAGVLRKLDKTLSVECAVNELISEATDTFNLATIFHGWGSLM